MNSIAQRVFSKLEYRDPLSFLVRLRQLELVISASPTPDSIRNLRTNSLKSERELRETAIFCYLVGQRMGVTVGLAPGECQDYDFVAAWAVQYESYFAPVQLKELPPEATAPKADLQGIITSLGKYTNSSELVVAIHLNRAITFDPFALDVQSLQIAELWAIGATSADQNAWALWGDLLHSPTISYHTYPTS